MPDLLLAAAILFVLIVLDVAAHRYGADSRVDAQRDRFETWW